jgi:hypothetical protein
MFHCIHYHIFMQRIGTLLLALVLPLSCFAAEKFPTLDAYLAHATGKADMLVAVAHSVSVDGKLSFGIAHEKASGPRAGMVFVVKENADGSVQEVDRSKPFVLPDPSKTAVETVEAQSPGRFSMQLNSRTACSEYVMTYRFAKVGGRWHASGLDTLEPECGKDGSIDVKSKRSTNFLSGKVIEQRFRNGKPSARTTKTVRFPSFPLADFEAFDAKHEPN